MCIACEWAEQASLLEKWRESRALRALADEAPAEDEARDATPSPRGEGEGGGVNPHL